MVYDSRRGDACVAPTMFLVPKSLSFKIGLMIYYALHKRVRTPGEAPHSNTTS